MKTRILDTLIGLILIGFGLFFIVNIIIDMIDVIDWQGGLDWWDLKFYTIMALLVFVIMYAGLRLLVKAIIYFINDYKGVME